MNMPFVRAMEAIATGSSRVPRFASLQMLVPVGNINAKPIPRWPDRRSYRSHARDAAKLRNTENGGAR